MGTTAHDDRSTSTSRPDAPPADSIDVHYCPQCEADWSSGDRYSASFRSLNDRLDSIERTVETFARPLRLVIGIVNALAENYKPLRRAVEQALREEH